MTADTKRKADPNCGCCWCHDGVPSECCELYNTVAVDTKRGGAPQHVRVTDTRMLPLSELREALAAQGLYVVTAAEKAVLDACEQVPEQQLRFTRFNGGYLGAVAAAELARREAPRDAQEHRRAAADKAVLDAAQAWYDDGTNGGDAERALVHAIRELRRG